VNPAVLKWAREIAGYELDDLARSASTKPERMQLWEAGEAQPTLSQLRNIAWALRRPPAFFFRVEPPDSDLPRPPDFRTTPESAEPSRACAILAGAALNFGARYAISRTHAGRYAGLGSDF
jgi:transcriptional regulator with XRE-family HTH domain